MFDQLSVSVWFRSPDPNTLGILCPREAYTILTITMMVMVALKDRVLHLTIMMTSRDKVLHSTIRMTLKDRVLHLTIMMTSRDKVLHLAIRMTLKDRVLHLTIYELRRWLVPLRTFTKEWSSVRNMNNTAKY